MAFPAIATGVYGFPEAQAARIAVATVRSAPTRVERVVLVAFGEESHAVLGDALGSGASG